LIYVKNEKIKKKLSISDFPLTNELEKAKVIFIQPAHLSDIQKSDIQNTKIPMFLITSEMLSLPQWEKAQSLGILKIINPDEIFAILQEYMPEVFFVDDTEPFEQNVTTIPPVVESTTPYIDSYEIQAHVAISFSTVGGVGKTFLTLNLATCTALKGIKTVVIDLDLRSSELDFAAGLTDPVDRRKIVAKKAKVPKDSWVTVANWRGFNELEPNILRHNSGLYVIPCFPMVNQDIKEHDINELIHSLSKEFDFIMIDGGLDFTQPHLKTALDIANNIFLLGDQEVKTLGKISDFMAQEKRLAPKVKLILNMVTPTGYYQPVEIAQILNFKHFDTIPLDKTSVQTARRKKKAAVQLPKSKAGQAVWSITHHLPFNIALPVVEKSLFDKIKNFFKGERR